MNAKRIVVISDTQREKMREAVRKCRAKHLEKYRKTNAEYVKNRWRNDPRWREVLRERKRLAYNSNPEHRKKRLEANYRWNKSEKGRHYFRKRDHANRGDFPKLTYREWVEILDAQKNRCRLCGREFDLVFRPQRDHIFPLKHGGKLVRENVQALCKPCNTRKGARIWA